MHRYSRIESALLAFPGLLLVINTTILQANLPVYARDAAPADAAGSIEKNKAEESPKKGLFSRSEDVRVHRNQQRYGPDRMR